MTILTTSLSEVVYLTNIAQEVSTFIAIRRKKLLLRVLTVVGFPRFLFIVSNTIRVTAETTMANDILEGSTDVSLVDSGSVKKADLGTEKTSLSTPRVNNEASIETTVDHTKSEKQHDVQEDAREAVAAEAATKETVEEDNEEYPKKWRLALITIALCLSVFCMALVSPEKRKCRNGNANLLVTRIILSLQRLFHELRINSMLLTMSGGTVPRIY